MSSRRLEILSNVTDSRLWRSVLLFCAAFLPAIFTAVLVDRFAVNIPVWDDWERVRTIEMYERGELSIADLYAPHIEHRIFFPRLVMLALNRATGGDLHAEMMFILATVLATAVAVFLLLRSAFPNDSGILYGTAFCANLLLFSPMQWENFLWAIQVAFMLPMCCICWSLVVLHICRAWPVWKKFSLCLVLALIATHSFSHGLLAWPVVFAMAFLQHGFSPLPRNRLIFLGTWAAVAAVVFVFYFHGLENTSASAHAYNQKAGEQPPGLAHLDSTISNLNKVFNFFGAFLGNPLARITSYPARDVAPWIGWGTLMAFGIVALWWLRHWKSPELRNQALPWLALGGSAIAIALMVALGRSYIAGVRSALTPRYISMSLYLLLAVAVLAILFTVALRASPDQPRRGRKFLAFIAGAFLVTQVLSWNYGIQQMNAWESSRLHARTSLLFINHFLPQEDTRLDPDPTAVKELAGVLNDFGYLDPPLFETTLLEDNFRKASRPLSPNRWDIDRAEVDAEKAILRLEGFTMLPAKAGGRASHGVLITRKNAAGDDEVIQIASVHAVPQLSPAGYDHRFNYARELTAEDVSQWSISIPLSNVFREQANGNRIAPEILELWAVEARKLRVQQLGARIEVHPDGTVTVDKLR